jgi:hypothetical protein
MTSFGLLPNDVLLDIFDFYVAYKGLATKTTTEAWQILIHVCRRWRHIVFGSPRRLDLRLFCTANTPAKDLLDIWPAFPILVNGHVLERIDETLNLVSDDSDVDNIVAALKRSDRVCQIMVACIPSQMEKVSAAMGEPFPELTDLWLKPWDEMVAAFPDSFLGGFAPRLRSLWLDCIAFPGLPRLLLSATGLVALRLLDIPHSGYVAPDAMVTGLSALTHLRTLQLHFKSPQSFPAEESQPPPPRARFALPLGDFYFRGVSEYLDDFLARIDAPELNYLGISFFNQIDFDAPQLVRFLNRTPSLKKFEKACITFGSGAVGVKLSTRIPYLGALNMNILADEFDWQLSSLAQFCNPSIRPLPIAEDLYIYEFRRSLPDQQDDFETTEWLQVLRPFNGVKDLYLSKEVSVRLTRAMQEMVGGTMLPILKNVFLEGFQPSTPIPEGISQFVAERQLHDNPIFVSRWDRDPEQETF